MGDLNGYKLLADSYRHLINKGEITADAEVMRKIEIYDFLSTCSQDDICTLVDSSACNSIITAYCSKAMDNAGCDGKTKDDVLHQLHWLFDSVGAQSIVNKN